MAYNCKIIADSISPTGKRLTTFEITFPRIILAEFNTHRMFSRNSASSRAIPFKKQLERIANDPFIPEKFPVNGKGMQPLGYITPEKEPEEYERLVYIWKDAMYDAIGHAKKLYEGCADDSENGEWRYVHKQIVNRLLEPWMQHTVVITASEFSNFFAQRCSESAQYEIKRIADLMYKAYHWNAQFIDGIKLAEDKQLDTIDTIYSVGFNSIETMNSMEPKFQCAGIKYLKEGEWHLPYIDDETLQELDKYDYKYGLVGDNAKAISVARCARVSYLNQEGKRDIQSDLDLYNRLVEGNHWSPFEHVATPYFTGNPEFPKGLVDTRNKNFIGWKQFRSYFPNENITEFRKD